MLTHQVLYSRAGNENSTTPPAPVGPYVPGAVDLETVGSFCLYWDDDRRVQCTVYEVREIALPDWLSVREYCRDAIKWKWVWGCGVDPAWPERWQRASLSWSTLHRVAAAKLLRSRPRSAFRSSLRQQLLDWLECESHERSHPSPFSRRQWDALCDGWVQRDARRLDNSLYRDRSYHGAPVRTPSKRTP